MKKLFVLMLSFSFVSGLRGGDFSKVTIESAVYENAISADYVFLYVQFAEGGSVSELIKVKDRRGDPVEHAVQRLKEDGYNPIVKLKK